jgi:hypothetical protein
MNELLQQLPQLTNTVICAVGGTFFAYMQKYAWAKTKPISIRFYLFGDIQAVARAATKLIGAVSVALVSDMLASMDLTGLIALGIGIGLAVPEQVQAEERKQKEDNQPEKAEVKA